MAHARSATNITSDPCIAGLVAFGICLSMGAQQYLVTHSGECVNSVSTDLVGGGVMGECAEKQKQVETRMGVLAEGLTEKAKALGLEIQNRAKELAPDFDTNGPLVWVNADIKIDWKTTELSLDLPEVTMNDQKMSLDLPQVTVHDQEMIFHTPSVRMEPKKVGQYPELYCENPLNCTVRWSDIIIDVPVPFMQEQRIVMGLPEVKMDRTEFVIGVPEFTMKTHKFSLDLPQITVKDIAAEASLLKHKGEVLASESKTRADELKKSFVADAKMEMGVDVAAMFECFQTVLSKKKNDALKGFEDGIAVLQATITSMVGNKVPDDNEMLTKVRKSLEDVMKQRETFAKTIEQKFIDLNEQQKTFFEKFIAA